MQFLESYVLKKITKLLTGELKVSSYLDKIGHIENVYEVRGTYYELARNGVSIRSYDFSDFVTIARHPGTTRVLYNHNNKDLLDLFTPTDANSDVPPVSVAPTRKFYFCITILLMLLFSSIFIRSFAYVSTN